MKLWSIQSEEVYEILMREGIYHCSQEKMSLPELIPWYRWMAGQMKIKTGEAPNEVVFPVWAWHTYNWKHKKPDLREVRWSHGYPGERLVCIELEVPDEELLLSDFDAWSIILLDCLISYTEEENNMLESRYENLPKSDAEKLKAENWQRVFDVSRRDSKWLTTGKWVQAVFWELRKEQVISVRHFTAGKRVN